MTEAHHSITPSLQPALLTVTLARYAMATRFEIVLHGDDSPALRAAGEEALNEIERLEAQLSLYRPTSEIAHLNARAAREAVQVSPTLFALLEHAQRLNAETNGAFDITIAPLVRCWGFMGGSGKIPGPDEVADARAKIGMAHVQLNARNRTVRFDREGVMLDPGAIGKGYAVEKAAELLREAGVKSALIHGGTSTAYAIGRPPNGEAWTIAIEKPALLEKVKPAALALIPLRDESLSVSAVWGKFFQTGERKFGHVLNPRTGEPVTDALLAAVVSPSGTETDALSTALLVLGRTGHATISSLRPGIKTLLVTESGNGFEVETNGVRCCLSEPNPPPHITTPIAR